MILGFFSSFLLGLLTPLTAVCVLPLFPGFLAFLANQDKKHPAWHFALLVSAGTILFMLIFGVLFSTILEVALTNVIAILTPIAMGLLIIISLFLLADFNFNRIIPHFNAPEGKSPHISALLYGFFFGAIILPCNPGFIAAMFAKTLITSAAGFFINFLHFLLFGIGMAAPLLVLALASTQWNKQIMGFLTRYKSWINRITGGLMLAIALYYLFAVFRIHEVFL